MEKDVALGKVGGLKLSLAAGKATLDLSAQESVLDGAVMAQASMSVVVGADMLVDMLFAEIEAKSPAGVKPIEETVKAIVKQAVVAIQ